MKPVAFDYHRPESVSEAVALLSELREDAAVLAGGMTLGPMLNLRMVRPRAVIDIYRIQSLKTISLKSCGVLSSMGPSVQWVHSYVTADRIYCIYHAADESLVRRHAELGGFPANKISRVTAIIDPATAE